jgi:hypothetical protein
MTNRLRPVPRPRRFLLAAALSISAASVLALPTPAGAATTIGSDLATAPGIGSGHALGLTSVLRAFPGRQVTAPTDGVIVAWRIRVGGSSNAQLVELRVIRGTGAASTGAGSGQAESVPAAPGIYTFAAALPIAAGDFIGIDVLPSGTTGTFFGAGPPGTQRENWVPPLADGESRAPNSSNSGGVSINADIEPDCDQDGLGDETQDSTLFGGDCPLRGRNVTLDASRNKVKKRKKVTLSGRITELVRQGECESGQGVELQRKRPKQTTFTTIEQLLTDATGNFSAEEKVKKTFEYRAEIDPTAGCAGGLSNTEKVKVKKKRG